MREHRAARCTGVEVVISSRTVPDSMMKHGVAAELARYDARMIGRPLTGINLRELEKHMQRFNNFESVEVSFTTGNRLRIDVVPMIPALRVFNSSGSYYINKDGKRIDAKVSFHADVPLVSGNFTSEYPPQKLLPLTDFIARDSLLKHLVTMIYMQDPDNIILIPRLRGHVINFGSTERPELKTRALKAMYKQVLPYRGWETYDTISLRFNGQVVATRANKYVPDRHIDFTEDYNIDEDALQGHMDGLDSNADSNTDNTTLPNTTTP